MCVPACVAWSGPLVLYLLILYAVKPKLTQIIPIRKLNTNKNNK